MALDIEQLSVTLQAKIDDFKRDMRAAGQEFDSTAGQIEKRNSEMIGSISRQMNGMGATANLLAGFLKGAFSVYAVEQFVSAIKNANQALTNLNHQAEDTRLSVRDLMGLRFEGLAQGASTAEIDTALKQFSDQSKKTEEDARGLYKSLADIDPALSAAFKNADSQTERVNILSQGLVKAKNETQRFELAQNALGTTNERVIRTFEQAQGNIATLADRAREAGIRIDDGLSAKADEAQKKLDALAEVSGDKLKVALSGLIPIITYLAEFIGKVAAGARILADAAEKMAGLDTSDKALPQAPYTVSPDGTIHYDTETSAGLPFQPPLPSRRPEGTGGSGGKPAFAELEDYNKKESAQRNEFDREEAHIEKQTRQYSAQAEAVGKLGAEGYKAEASMRLLLAAEQAGITPTDELKEKISQLAEKYAEARQNIDRLKLAEDLRFQRLQLGRTEQEAAIASELRSRGQAEGTEDYERFADELRTIKGLTEAKTEAHSFLKGMITDMQNGVRFGKALENQLKRIADRLLDKTLDSALSGLFKAGGGLFGFGGGGGTDFGGGAIAAEGDVITAAGGGIVGQIGSRMRVPLEAFRGAKQFQAGGGVPAIVHPGELILNKAMQRNLVAQMGSSGGAPITVTHAPVINGVGASPEQISVMLARSQRDFARNIGTIFTDWQKRHGGGF